MNHNKELRQYTNHNMQLSINKKSENNKITINKSPVNLSGTAFKKPNKNKKNHSGSILSDVFKVSTMTHDSSWKTKYQLMNIKYIIQNNMKNAKNISRK